MLRSFSLVVALVFAGPALLHAQSPKYVQVTGVVGGAQLNVKALNQAGNYVGVGALATYNLKVTSGQVQQNRYISLQGVILAPNGAPFTNFSLNADRVSGGIVFLYTVNGKAIRQTTIGSVQFFQ